MEVTAIIQVPLMKLHLLISQRCVDINSLRKKGISLKFMIGKLEVLSNFRNLLS